MKYGTPGAVELLSDYMFTASKQDVLMVNKMTGPLPKGGMKKVLRGERVYSKRNAPIVECYDLKLKGGADVRFNLRGPVFGKPFKGKETFEGKGKRMPWDNASLTLNFTAFPVFAGDLVDQQVTTHDLYTNAKDAAIEWATGYNTESAIVQMYGDRGYETSMNWSIPLASDPDFATIMDNEVLPPTRNRHYRADGDTVARITNTAGVLDFATTDVMSLRVIEKLITANNESTYPVGGCKFVGDDQGAEDPLGLLWVTEPVYDAIKASGTSEIQEYLSAALTRRSRPGQHTIFQRAPLLWKNCLVVIQPKPIRFYPGDAMTYCNSLTAETTTSATVPTGAGWDNLRAIDRSVFVGAMALGKIVGGHDGSKYGVHKKLAGFLWSEKWLNHDTRLEVAAMMFNSFGKFRFDLDWGGVEQPTDYGVAVIDSVVEIPSLV
jgi:hypothetical protein